MYSLQVYSLKSENKLLEEKLLYARKEASATMQEIREGDEEELPCSENDSIHSSGMKLSEDLESSKSFQAGILLNLFHSL